MSDFATFYLNGGIFNHFVTLALGFAAMGLVLHARMTEPASRRRWLDLVDRALVACLGLGLLGTAMGMTDVCAVLVEVSPELYLPAAARGLSIALIPLEWALLGALPFALVVGARRARETT